MLAPCYLIHGGEPLQTEELICSIKAEATKQGYTNNVVFEINVQFEWEQLLNQCLNFDLFADKSVVELRLQSENIGKPGSQVLEQLLRQQASDICIIIRAPKLKSQTLNSSWVNAIAKYGKIHVAKPITAARWSAWVQQRLERAGFRATTEVVHAVASCYEGSMTAAAQFVDHCKAIIPPGVLEVDQIKPFLNDNAKFTVFELCDAAIIGNSQRTFSIFHSLRNEGVDPVLVLWGLTREIRSLIRLGLEIDKGTSLAQSAQKIGIWRERVPDTKKALDRITVQKLQNLLKISKIIDTILKGVTPGNAWDLLLAMCMTIAGKQSLITEELNL